MEPLDDAFVDGQDAVVEKPGQGNPMVEQVADGLAECGGRRLGRPVRLAPEQRWVTTTDRTKLRS
jgi:hypothetical protein